MDIGTLLTILNLAGGVGAFGVRDDPTKQWLRNAQAAGGLIDRRLATLPKQFYDLFLQSPAYTTALNQAIGGAQAINTNMLRLGGIGDTRTALSGGTLAGAVGGIHTGAWNQAFGQAMQALQLQLSAGQGVGGQKFGFPQQYGALLDTLSKLSSLYPMKPRVPGANQPVVNTSGFGGGGAPGGEWGWSDQPYR